MDPDRPPDSADALPSAQPADTADASHTGAGVDVPPPLNASPALGDVLAHASVPVFVTSPAGMMIYLNAAGARLMGLTEATPLPIDVRVFYTDVSLRDSAMAALRRGENPVIVEGDFVSLDGRVHHGRTMLQPVWRGPGDLDYLVGTVVEATELTPKPATAAKSRRDSRLVRHASLEPDRSPTSSDAALVIDLDNLTILEANVAAALLFAVPRQRLLGRALTAHIDEAALRPLLARLRRNGQAAFSALAVKHADGARINTEGHGALTADGGGAGQCVLMLRSTNWVTATQASLRLITDALEQTVEAVALLTPDGRVQFANQALGKLLGVDAGRLIARHITELGFELDSEPLQLEQLTPTWAGRLHGQRLGDASGESPFVAHASFTQLIDEPADTSDGPADGDRRLLGTVAILRDMTADLEMQRKMLQTEKLAAIGTLVEGATHELNNRLAPVLGFAQLLADEPGLSDSARQGVDQIQTAARACRRILTGLLDFAAAKPEHVETFDWRDAVDQVLDVFRRDVDRLGITIATNGRGVFVRASREQIKVVVFNLIKNAIEAVKPGVGSIDLTVAAIGEQAVFEICDNGPGIPRSQLPRLFDPFFTTKGDLRGTGLGLSTCYGIVTDAGGSIRADNAKGGGGSCPGARLVVTLPLAEPGTRRPTGRIPPRTSESDASLAGRVLVVDDERAMVQLLTRMLESRGLTVYGTCDPHEALQLTDAFDLVITDIRMPALSGQDLATRMRKRLAELAPDAAPPAFLFVTGDTTNSDELRGLVSDRSDVIAKPFDVMRLLEIVRRLLAADPRASSAPAAVGEVPRARGSNTLPAIGSGEPGVPR